MLKKSICIILSFIFIFQNLVFASDDWVRITSDSGKTMDINTSNFAIFDDYISIFTRAQVKNEVYLYNLHINCEEKTFQINNIKRVKGNKEENITDYKDFFKVNHAGKGSLNESMIMFVDDYTKYDIRRQDWGEWMKYHLDVMKTFKKVWKPKFKRNTYSGRVYLTCCLTIDKKGNIIYYTIDVDDKENSKLIIDEVKNNDAIIKSVENAVEKVKKVHKLPKGFKGGYIKIKLAFVYKYRFNDTESEITEPDEYGYRNLKICKEKLYKFSLKDSDILHKTGKFIGDTIVVLIVLPFAIVAGVLGFIE